jgi:hypothetical protein
VFHPPVAGMVCASSVEIPTKWCPVVMGVRRPPWTRCAVTRSCHRPQGAHRLRMARGDRLAVLVPARHLRALAGPGLHKG